MKGKNPLDAIVFFDPRYEPEYNGWIILGTLELRAAVSIRGRRKPRKAEVAKLENKIKSAILNELAEKYRTKRRVINGRLTKKNSRD